MPRGIDLERSLATFGARLFRIGFGGRLGAQRAGAGFGGFLLGGGGDGDAHRFFLRPPGRGDHRDVLVAVGDLGRLGGGDREGKVGRG